MTDYGSFDPEKFSLGGFLDGREGRIETARFTTFDYNGTVDPPANVLNVDITRDDGETRSEKYGIGACRANEDGLGYTGNMRKTCKCSKFFVALKQSGFPMAELSKVGMAALDGSMFLWKHVPGQGDNTYALPDKYLGTDGESAASEEDTEFTELLNSAIVGALRDGPLKKVALSAKVSPALNGHPKKTKALTLLVSDTYLNAVEGVAIEAGVVSLT